MNNRIPKFGKLKQTNMNAQTNIRRRMTPDSLLRHITTFSPFVLRRSTYKTTANFLPALAHEVRNPLSTINLAAELLNQSSLDEEQRQFIHIIQKGSERIKELINNLLLPAQSTEDSPGLYSTSQLLEEALLLAKDRILLKNIAVSKEYAETGPGVRIDKEKMKIALTNIIVNAIDAMSSEGGQLKLVTKSTGEHTTMEIHDNGIGINEECLKNIFMPYFTNKKGGLGLGLAVTQDILRANHATVKVRSAEGVGTCFILSFHNESMSTGSLPANITAFSTF